MLNEGCWDGNGCWIKGVGVVLGCGYCWGRDILENVEREEKRKRPQKILNTEGKREKKKKKRKGGNGDKQIEKRKGKRKKEKERKGKGKMTKK